MHHGEFSFSITRFDTLYFYPPIPPTPNLSLNTQTEDLVHEDRIDSSDGRVLALHAKGPGFESRCGKQ